MQTFPALISNVNSEGSSPLHWAATTGDVAVASTLDILLSTIVPLPVLFRLLEFPFDERFVKDVETNNGSTYRYEVYFVGITKTYCRCAIDVNILDGNCRTAFYSAVAEGGVELVDYFLKVI